MQNDEIDTSTAEGFLEGLKTIQMTTGQFAALISTPDDTVRSWVRGRRPVHPTAARMLDWLIEGYRPADFHITGERFKAMRERLELTEDELAEILDVETETVIKWEGSFGGPPRFVAKAMWWLTSRNPPIDLPTASFQASFD
ncbi:hypothetical protein [Roseovarius sp. MMSF_3281]|uniref:hypothetical protein n=1 Tax=Roseovarius sp. MMSF_3281 TaxID=3046694 RepID=UPI00273E4C6F|nr:hypothetical protein [Roseovarius sp. MMSF_3281]